MCNFDLSTTKQDILEYKQPPTFKMKMHNLQDFETAQFKMSIE